jgi:cell division protein FtsZ
MSEMGMAMMGTGVGTGDNRARIAAEAAIASPLLEDVDLSGAKGVLVNITAGLDLSIGEFEEVGDVVKGITSESATVVVGTVIDPELRDEVRVTVIVTGLGRKQVGVNPVKMPIEQLKAAGGEGLEYDFSHLERPAIIRRQGIAATTTQLAQPQPLQVATPAPAESIAHVAPRTAPQVVENHHDIDYLDIPAFLRRKEEATS